MTTPRNPAEKNAAPASAELGPAEAYLLPLYRARWLIALAVLLGAITGVLAGVLQPDQYASVGKLLVRAGERERIRMDSVDDAAHGGTSNMLGDELQLFANEGIYRRVATRIGPRVIVAPPDPARVSGSKGLVAAVKNAQSWYFRRTAGHVCAGTNGDSECPECLALAQQMLVDPDRTQVATIRGTNVITVTHTTHDPMLAKRVVDALIDEFDARHQEVYSARGAVQLLKRREEDVLREIAAAEQELMATRDKLGIADLDTERAKLLDRQYDLEMEIANVSLRLRLAETRQDELRKRREPLPPIITRVQAAEQVPNPAYTTRQTHLKNLEQERSRLLETYRSDAALVQAKDRLIASEREALATIEPFQTVEATSEEVANPAYVDISTELDELAQEIASFKTTKTEKDAILKAAIERLRYLRENEPLLTQLSIRTQTLRKSAEESTAALESKRVLEALDTAKISNLIVLSHGSSPTVASGPPRVRLILIGACAGLVLGAVLAFARSLLSRSVRSARDLERLTGLPVLASVPRRRRLSRGVAR